MRDRTECTLMGLRNNPSGLISDSRDSDVTSLHEAASTEDKDDPMGLKWLFDPTRIDHLPITDQLLFYKSRDLVKGKVFNVGRKIWGNATASRRRVIVAPPMRTTARVPHGIKTVFTTPLNPQPPPPPTLPAVDDVEERYKKYKDWMAKRKADTAMTEKSGLSLQYLWRKPDRTELEEKLLRKMWKDITQTELPQSLESDRKYGRLPRVLPKISRPTPVAVGIIGTFLMNNKMRLVDLFAHADKDKDWKIPLNEFRVILRKFGVGISEQNLSDLVNALNVEQTDQVDYRKLAKGLSQWKLEYLSNRYQQGKSVAFKRNPTELEFPSEMPEEVKNITLSYKRPRSTTSLSRSPDGRRKTTALESTLHHESPPQTPNKDSPPASPGGIIRERSVSAPSSAGKRSRPGSKTVGFKDSGEETQPNSRPVSRVSSSFSSSTLGIPEPDMTDDRLWLSSEAMVDLRKRDRAALKKFNEEWKKDEKELQREKSLERLQSNLVKRRSSTSFLDKDNDPTASKSLIRTGDRDIDNNCQPSTLNGDIGNSIDTFRQKRYMEYHNICAMCTERGVPLSEGLLKKVMLFPPDKKRTSMLRSLATPKGPLYTKAFEQFKNSYGDSRTAIEGQGLGKNNNAKVPSTLDGENGGKSNNTKSSNNNNTGYEKDPTAMRTKNDTLILDNRLTYPVGKHVKPVPTKMKLSTGDAHISRKVDCWLTYEEYKTLTSTLETRYSQIHGPSDANAFWPGHLLDKIVLVLPKPPQKQLSIFASTIRRHPDYMPLDTKKAFSTL